MTDGIMLQISDDGKATLYESTYDITIHCDSEKEQHEVMERLNSTNWIPVSERLPEKAGKYLVTVTNGNVYAGTFDKFSGRFQCAAVAWMPLPQPYKGETR